MEVDLVICFDAIISPLRMIQRMGRTGRKHDRRVVVLACEGSELKGYMRKQANSKAIRKHMRNGGMNSFNFHSSPRMIPHIFKPEIQFIELSIEQFIPRGRKVKEENPIQSPLFKAKLTDSETNLLAKYFLPPKESTWRSSLTAFPHFQAFPSIVHKVLHSFRTGMLIDTMQCLQGLSFTGDTNAFFVEDDASSNLGLLVETVELNKNCLKDECLTRKLSDSDPLPMETSATEDNHCLPGSHGQNPPSHSHLFGSGFVSVDSVGVVLVPSVPVLPLEEISHSKCTSVSNPIMPNCLKQDSLNLKSSFGEYKETTPRVEVISNQPASSQTKCKENKNILTSKSGNYDAQQENNPDGADKFYHTQVSEVNLSNGGDSICEASQGNKKVVMSANDPSIDLRDVELSPRLTNFIESGVVPESPIDNAETPKGKGMRKLVVPDSVSPAKSNSEVLVKSSIPKKDEKEAVNGRVCRRDAPDSSVNEEIQTPILNMKCIVTSRYTSAFPIIEEVQNPLENSINKSCSKDWCLSSGGKSESVQQKKKFRRLRKYGDQGKWTLSKRKEQDIGLKKNKHRAYARPSPSLVKNGRGNRKPVEDVQAFIEEEAEVSSEVEVSDDEEDEQDNNSYDDSFIDDRINPTAASTQAEASRGDMMAFYRRSLLSQSPLKMLPNCSTDFSPNSVASRTQMSECGSSPGMTNHFLQTPQTGSDLVESNSASFQLESKRLSSEGMRCTRNVIPCENENRMGQRKRKLSFHQVGSLPAINLDQEFLSHSEEARGEVAMQDQLQKVNMNGDIFNDDRFYEGLDLDAVEEQAAKLLGHKSELPKTKGTMIPDPTPPQLGVLDSPSFDLGI